MLWKTIVSNPLLFKTNLVLFLNKTDILKAKLRGGIRVSDYILSYGKRPNDYENASACELPLSLVVNPLLQPSNWVESQISKRSSSRY